MHKQTSVAPSAPAIRLGALRLLDLPHLVFAVVFLWLLFRTELNDPDYFWHLKAGEYIVSHMALPSGDPFSYTFQGKPWVLSAWLFEAVLYGVFTLLGTTGIKLLTATLGTVSTYIVYRAANRLLGASTLALALAITYFTMLASGFVPRPQLVTYVLLAVFVHLLVAFKYFADDRRLWLIAPLLVLWVNMHGAYMIGIVLLGLFCACEWLIHLTGPANPAHRRRLIILSLIGLAGALATAINPAGIAGWLFPLEVLHSSEVSIPVIAEFQSLNFHHFGGKVYLVLAFGFILASIYRQTKPDLTEIALPVFFLYIGFVSVRHTPLAMLVLVPFVAVALRDGPVQRLYRRLTASGKQLGTVEYVLNWGILVVVGVTFYLLNPAQQARAQARLNEAMPVKAVEFVKRHGITGRMFNDYVQGGYLIYHLYPEQQVFIDGRADIYGGRFLEEFINIFQGVPGWDKAFDKYAIDYLIVRRDAPIRERLLSRGDFKMVYDDAAHSVLVRKLPQFEQLAEQKAE